MDNSVRKDEIAKQAVERLRGMGYVCGTDSELETAFQLALTSYEEERTPAAVEKYLDGELPIQIRALIKGLDPIRRALRERTPRGEGWQSTITLRDPRRLVWLWTPAWKLSDRSDQEPDMRVSTLANWTWATMWQPCPMPTPPDGQNAKDATPPASSGRYATDEEAEAAGDREASEVGAAWRDTKGTR
jgi:hypothetical protein